MLQVAGDLRLEQEPRPLVLPLGVAGLDLLEGDLALELAIPGHPDLADPPLGMRTDELEPLRLRGAGMLRALVRPGTLLGPFIGSVPASGTRRGSPESALPGKVASISVRMSWVSPCASQASRLDPMSPL